MAAEPHVISAPSELLTPKRITVLADTAGRMFDVFYDIERQQRRAAKTHLTAELDTLDLFGPRLHYTNHEDYTPGGGQG